MDKKKVVFVCAHNAGKSRVAEAYLKEIAGDRFEVSSAGTTPGDSENPAAAAALAEKGLSLREGPGVALTPDDAADADLVVTFGCDVTPVAADAPVEDWELKDESGAPLRDYGDIRDAIFERVDDLVKRFDA
ncbi:MAG TPA: low molecular weight phosphatase family protein [Actinomycetota bacterium]|nr:low molecular weight phosphatase family protein [Actinomycetota bacterium]